MKNYKDSPIIITGAERSGSSMIAKIVELAGGAFGEVNGMMENKGIQEASKLFVKDYSIEIPFPKFKVVAADWKEIVQEISEAQKIGNNTRFSIKSSLATPLWSTWHAAYPDAKWIIVRRRPIEIINSCLQTSHMRLFKDPDNQKLVSAGSEEVAWLWWIHKYEETWTDMIQAGLNVKIIWPERMVVGDYGQIYEMLEWLGLEWTSAIPTQMDPLFKKSRRK